MRIEVTKAQLRAIKNLADTISAMVGCSDKQTDKDFKHSVKMVDVMLTKNGLKQRDFK